MDKRNDNTYLPEGSNSMFLRETQTKGSETYSISTFNELRYVFDSLPSPPDSEEEQFEDGIATWSKEKVAKWIRSILKEVALHRYPSQQTLDLFTMDGKSLLYISAAELYERDPDLGHIISEKLMDMQKRSSSTYSPDFSTNLTSQDMMWSGKANSVSSTHSDSSDSEIDIPCTSLHEQQPMYVPLASSCSPSLAHSDTSMWHTNVMLPPFMTHPTSFAPLLYNPQMNIEEAAVTIKKEPNYSMHSPTGLYPEQPYDPEYYFFSPACRPGRPTSSHSPVTNNKRQCLHVDPKGIEGIPKQAQLYEFILKVLSNPINQHILSWKDKSKGIFSVNDTKAFACLWGLHRNSDNMSYEKLSRAMRYYYRRNILEQIKGRRLYKFTAQMNKQIMEE